MSKITHPDLPAYRPGMADTGLALISAFRAHWAAHNGAYPQRLILTPQQSTDLYESRLLGCVATPGASATPRDSFLGRPIEISETTVGEVVAHDGTVMVLPDYLPKASGAT